MGPPIGGLDLLLPGTTGGEKFDLPILKVTDGGFVQSPLKKQVYILCEVVSALVDKELTWLM